MADAKRDGNYVTTLLAVSSVDGVTPVTLYANPTTHRLLVDLAGGGSGTVQTISIASANGFAGTSDANPSAPTLTISTTVTGILKGNGTAISAAVAGDVDSILPDQTGNSGKYLTTDGVNSSWGTISGGGNVSNTGTPVNNQIAVWTDATTIEGDTSLTFDTATDTLTVAGEVVTPEIQAASSAGLAIRSNSGSLVADFGAGGGQNATFEDGTTIKGLLTVGSGAADGTIQSNGNYDLILKTGNATTGSITIADGASGNITIAPNGSGDVIVKPTGSTTVFSVQDSTAVSTNNTELTSTYGSQVLTDGSSGSNIEMFAADSSTYLIVEDFNDTNIGPFIQLQHNSTTPAASDVVGLLYFTGEDSGGAQTNYGTIKGVITDPTAASEDGKLVFRTITAGTEADELELTGAALYPTTNNGLDLGTSSLLFNNTYTTAIELGAASDTTISRVSAGVIAVEGNNVILANTTATRSMMLTASGGNPTTTSGCASPTKVEAGTNDVDYFVLDFDAGTIEYAFWNVVMPDNYNGGTITATFYWTAAAGSAGNVVWALQGRAYADDAAIDQAWGTAQEVTDAWIANGDVHISSATAAITLGGSPAGGQYAALRAYRNATSGSDTMPGDARLLSIKVEYTINAYTE